MYELIGRLYADNLQDGKVVKQEDVTGETKYVYNPGNEGAGVNTDVTLKVTLDKNKYFLIGDLIIKNEVFTCSAN